MERGEARPLCCVPPVLALGSSAPSAPLTAGRRAPTLRLSFRNAVPGRGGVRHADEGRERTALPYGPQRPRRRPAPALLAAGRAGRGDRAGQRSASGAHPQRGPWAEAGPVEVNNYGKDVQVSFGVGGSTATEGGAGANLVITLDSAPGRNITIPISVAHHGGGQTPEATRASRKQYPSDRRKTSLQSQLVPRTTPITTTARASPLASGLTSLPGSQSEPLPPRR